MNYGLSGIIYVAMYHSDKWHILAYKKCSSLKEFGCANSLNQDTRLLEEKD